MTPDLGQIEARDVAPTEARPTIEISKRRPPISAVRAFLKRRTAPERLHQRVGAKGVYIQKLYFGCGPSTLINALRLKGLDHPNEVRVAMLCRANPQTGTDHNDLVEACPELGLDIIKCKTGGTISDLRTYADPDTPVVVNFIHPLIGCGHFGVVPHVDAENVYLMDSCSGFRSMTHKDFEALWHNSDGTNVRWFAALR